MSTTPTNQPVPSEKPQDLKFNAGKIDEFVTSMERQYIDRFGGEHYTIEGLRWLAQQAMAAFGYITLDSFEDGNTLTLPNQVLRLEATGEYYRWDGVLPKAVPAGSTPESTGGIGTGAWLSVGDAILRGDLAKDTGAGLVGTSSGNTVQKELDKIRLKFESFAAMRSSTASEIGDYALLTGWHAEHQGYGAGIFQCVDKNGLTDDGGTIAVGSTYAWKRITGPADATEFGVVPNAGSTFDNKAYIEAANKAGELILPAGEFYSTAISLTKGVLIGTNLSTLRQIAGDSSAVNFISIAAEDWWDLKISHGTIRDVQIYPLTGVTALYLSFIEHFDIENVYTYGGYYGCYLHGVGHVRLRSCVFHGASDTGCFIDTRETLENGSYRKFIGTFIWFSQCVFTNAMGGPGCVVSHVPSVFFEQCSFFYNQKTGLYCAIEQDKPGLVFGVVNASNCDFDSNWEGSIKCSGLMLFDLNHCWVGGPRNDNGAMNTVTLEDCPDFKITSNEIVEGTDNGLALYRCNRGSVTGNVLSGNKNCGLFLDSCNSITATGNTLGDLDWTRFRQKIGASLNGEHIVFTGNSLWKNTDNAIVNNVTVDSQVGYNSVLNP
ncbi:right-handed parallel beta-helix repeat-containing protein [Salmonella enterica]|nr:right-handed parallel beta-helix repeat-containing protein [Salmonella enterica]